MMQNRVVKFEERDGYTLYTRPENLNDGMFDPHRRTVTITRDTVREKEMSEIRKGLKGLRAMSFE